MLNLLNQLTGRYDWERGDQVVVVASGLSPLHGRVGTAISYRFFGLVRVIFPDGSQRMLPSSWMVSTRNLIRSRRG